MPPICKVLTLSCISPLSLRLIFLLSKIEKKIPIVINPKPPIWIINKITICPNIVQCVQVSTVTSPVTHPALTAVNKASKKDVGSPLFAAIGSISRAVPINIIIKNPTAIVCVCENCLFCFLYHLFFRSTCFTAIF